MLIAKDIGEKVQADFGPHAAEVMALLSDAILAADYLNDRVIRCIIFLAEQDVEKLRKYLNAALADPRDVMYWAEYINHDQIDKTTRVRDFSKPFER